MSGFDFPESWVIASIDDVAVKGEQRTPKDDESFIYIDIGSVDRNLKVIAEPQYLVGKSAPSRARKIVNAGDVLVSLTRPNLNAVAHVDKKYDSQIASTGFEVIKPIINSKFIFGLVRSRNFIESISEKVQGALYPAAKSTDVRGFEFGLPPLTEQQQIAQKLDELLAQVDTLKTRLDSIPKILKRFRQSVLAAAVSGTLTEGWRDGMVLTDVEEFVEEVFASRKGKLKFRKKEGWNKEINFINLPKNWAWIPCYKLAEGSSSSICAGPFGTIFKAKDFREEGIPIIFLRHVKEAGFNQRKPNYMDPVVWEQFHQEYSVHGGELLITKLGDPPGESCIYPEDAGTAMVTPDVIKMNVDDRVADVRYLMHFFNSPISKKIIADLAFGATRLRIDIPMFKEFPIPLPPREEQREILNKIHMYFSIADQIEQRVKDAQARVNHLAQSILAKAFRGELTADWRAQNPELISGENSAAALLERIRVEREELIQQVKPKRTAVKKKTGSSMSKQIIKVVDALKKAGEPLSGQQLLTAAGYSSDSNTEELEKFFLDIRDALTIEKSIVKLERSEDGQDWFNLPEASSDK